MEHHEATFMTHYNPWQNGPWSRVISSSFVATLVVVLDMGMWCEDALGPRP